MIDWSWITATYTELLMVTLSGLGIYVALLAFTRLVGLRSFSKMSSFDFAITVAFGSIIATTLVAKTPSLAVGAMGLAVLFGIQFIVSKTRNLTTAVERLVDNVPLLIMNRQQVLTDHLKQARITEEDLKAKLREAGITHRKQILAVVFETTGEVSVLKITDDIDPWLFKGIRGAEGLVLS